MSGSAAIDHPAASLDRLAPPGPSLAYCSYPVSRSVYSEVATTDPAPRKYVTSHATSSQHTQELPQLAYHVVRVGASVRLQVLQGQ